MRKIFRFFKWLYPGMRIKRWIFLCAVGIFCVGIGSAKVVSKYDHLNMFIGALLLLLGIVLLTLGIKYMVKSFISILLPERKRELVDILYQKRQLQKGPRITAIGGGTGLSVLLQGLKEYTSNITAIVTVADDGGSSGRIREEFDLLPPGDIRNCLVALADAEPLMRELFQFRFEENSELRGHNFGNLFITALSKITGDFEKAIKESSKVLAIRGQVVPSTLHKIKLIAEHTDGTKTIGESKIPNRGVPIRKLYLNPSECNPTEEALEAIYEAEAIILGPGSLYTSVLPNLLVKGVTEAILRAKAIKIYVCNVMTQSGETDNYTASDHVRTITEHTHPRIIDYCVVNTAPVPFFLQEKYKEENAYPVINDSSKIREWGYKVIEDDVISTTNFVRHSPEKLARCIIDLLISLRRGT
ncbi:MAG: YvcK family protein [Candidatus Omnitrophica bacterium]|nr:YvcK family protein [Candidatus Omnitrophota bacterium]MCM8793334.1 YvcK family protein [Candidatus Omnitrophota bacterium]